MVCTSCRNATSSVPAGWIADHDDASIGYALIQCSHCYNLLVIQEEATVWDGEKLVPDSAPIVLWPGRDAPLSQEIPEAARKSFEEARACHRAGQSTAAAIMVRRTLEAVCADKGATGNNLYEQIDELRRMNVIEGNLTEWAHGLRLLGNVAVHEPTVFIGATEVQDALELADSLLIYAYVLNAKYNAFKDRRNSSRVSRSGEVLNNSGSIGS